MDKKEPKIYDVPIISQSQIDNPEEVETEEGTIRTIKDSTGKVQLVRTCDEAVFVTTDNYLNETLSDVIDDLDRELEDHENRIVAIEENIDEATKKEDGGNYTLKEVFDKEREHMHDTVTESHIFDTEILTIQGIGGIKAGVDLNGMTLEKVLYKLIYPYLSPIIAINSTSPTNIKNTVYLEIGTSHNIESVSVKTQVRSNPIESIKLFINGQHVLTKDTDIINGDNTLLHSHVFTTDTTYSIEVRDGLGEDEKGQPFYNVYKASTAKATFVHPTYWGVYTNYIKPADWADPAVDPTPNIISLPDDGTIVNSDFITLGSQKRIRPRENSAYTVTVDYGNFFIAYPAAYGEIKSVKDPNNFEVFPSFTKYMVVVNTLAGPINYNLYVSDRVTVENSKFTYTF